MGSTRNNSKINSGESYKKLENRINDGKIKKTPCGSVTRKNNKFQKRYERLKNVTNEKYTVTKDLIDQYEKLYGKPDQLSFQKSESLPTPGSSRLSSIERSYPEPTTVNKDVKYSISPSSFIQTPKSPFSPTYVPIYKSSTFPSSPAFSKKPSPPPPPLFKTTKEVYCYTYYNEKSHDQINSFEPLESYNESNSWIINKSKVNVPAIVRESQVLELQQIPCWFYHNLKTGDNRRSVERLIKTDDEYEWCEPIEIKQFVPFPKEFSLVTEFKKVEDTILEEKLEENDKVVKEEEQEFATEKEIQEEDLCLVKVEEKGTQDAIKYIKENNKNDYNLIAYICRELSLKSPRNSDKFSTYKRKSAKKRLQDWIQYDAYPSMTLEQAEKLVVMLNAGSKVLVTGEKVSVCGNDLVTLKKRGWLNDEVINFYVELIVKRAANEPGKYPKIHMFNTFFYPLLEKKGYSGVARITRRAKVDIFSLDMVLVPIHLQIHWALAVINFKERRLEYYDSMSRGCNEHILSSLKRYVEEEYKDKKKSSSYDMNGWEYYRVNNLPQQNNAFDCGVFAMTFAEHISRGASVLFVPPKHMKYFRLKMMWEIVNSKLLPVDQQQHFVNNQHNGVSEPPMMNDWSINVNSSCPKRKFEDISAFIKT
ncbi:1477_t:CDS:1 [Funneliformis geosporum]|uniref:14939_t:CDS:1 n=1 Tax=Funneliformis geosporum TaxID=1117311 RepID=A0A9W4WVA4_9GLOM|nr:14939_t:CDS:1 [Funneliformis geosporum]CAI2175061.1 1477_t:CDS:1 [Funneliformis geosporum]